MLSERASAFFIENLISKPENSNNKLPNKEAADSIHSFISNSSKSSSNSSLYSTSSSTLNSPFLFTDYSGLKTSNDETCSPIICNYLLFIIYLRIIF